MPKIPGLDKGFGVGYTDQAIYEPPSSGLLLFLFVFLKQGEISLTIEPIKK
jgi:hypothetical protein